VLCPQYPAGRLVRLRDFSSRERLKGSLEGTLGIRVFKGLIDGCCRKEPLVI